MLGPAAPALSERLLGIGSTARDGHAGPASGRGAVPARPDWKALYLFRDGAPLTESASIAPIAYKILDEHVIQESKLCTLLESHFSTLLPARVQP
ncbi:hypothetical protein ACFVRU_59690 [Streptomyces sp. NPDC057927]